MERKNNFESSTPASHRRNFSDVPLPVINHDEDDPHTLNGALSP